MADVEPCRRRQHLISPDFSTACKAFFLGRSTPDGSIEELASVQKHMLHPPASLAKIMTALIFSEWLQKQDEEATTITISRKDRRRGSGNNLQPAETLTARDLMANLLLASSNTAAQAIARVVGDDIGAGETSFVKEMNRRAQSFGMLSTNFENAHGLHHADMVTTAADVALLASKAGEDRLVSSLWGKPRHWIKLSRCLRGRFEYKLL